MLNPKPATPRLNDEELSRVFNTAMVCTRAQSERDFSGELMELMKEPGFQAFLHAIRWLSESRGCPEAEAAEELIKTFRKSDRLWRDYLFQEGVDRVKA